MVEIKNDLLAATEQSSMLSSAISELDNSNSVTKDMQSKINGNERAKELIEKSFDISNLDLKFYIDQTMTLVKRWCVTQSNDTKAYTLEDLYTNALDTIRKRSYVTA